MAVIEFLIGTTGPYMIDSDDPLYSDPRQIIMKGDVVGMLYTTDIEDGLTSTSVIRVLSAKQGKVLKDLFDALAAANTGDQTLTTISGTLPVHANNAAAVAGGLVAGKLYRTGADPDVVCVVH